MSGIYWYASRQKIDALLPAFGPRGFSLFKELSVVLKAPFLGEAKASLNPERTVIANAASVEAGLQSADAVSDVEAAGSKTFFAFRGRALRAAEDGAYFVVLAQGHTALLLVGSIANAVGAPPKQSDAISPSADPVGAIQRAFRDPPEGREADVDPGGGLGDTCAYMWAALAHPVRGAWDALPEAEGIAVFGAAFESVAQFRRRGFAHIERVVVGTPLFVRQV